MCHTNKKSSTNYRADSKYVITGMGHTAPHYHANAVIDAFKSNSFVAGTSRDIVSIHTSSHLIGVNTWTHSFMLWWGTPTILAEIIDGLANYKEKQTIFLLTRRI